MASSSSISSTSSSSALSNLASVFQTAVKNQMAVEQQPLTKLQSQRDQVDVRKGVYNDIKTNLDALQLSIQGLISTEGLFSLTPTNKATVSPQISGSTVMTASATSSAVPGTYDIVVTQLAKAQSRASAAQTSDTAALGKSGLFWLGGNGNASASVSTNDVITSAKTSAVVKDQRELGTGTYTIETREESGVKQFRLVDADGKAVNIQETDGSGFTSGWQKMPSGEFDTGRGLTLSLDEDGTSTNAQVSYTARGTYVSINSTDSLKSIAAAINDAVQPEGHEVKASIVGKQLVITSANTGVNHAMIYTDNVGLGIGGDIQSAKDAAFSINGLPLTRPTNTGITDAISNVTINLTSDAEGKSAQLTIADDMSGAKTATDSFVSAFNTAFSHLTQKMAITSSTDGDKTTYTRGVLTGDLVFSTLRQEMIATMNSKYSNTGTYNYLSDIGISFDKDLKLTLDATKFQSALSSNRASTLTLLDSAMGKFNTMISTYTGSTGSLANSISSMDDQLTSYDSRIDQLNFSLSQRQKNLIDQYSKLQLQLAEWGNTATSLGITLDTSS